MERQEAARERLEILDAMIAAIERRAEVVGLVAAADSADDARRGIAELLAVSEVGADAILALQLRRLSRREVQRIRDERDELRAVVGKEPE
jgi:DNA gyrase/topoisomerase IV subunit A